MNLSDFDYTLPSELIAQEPLEDRTGSRLMVIDVPTGRIGHRMFIDLPNYLNRGDLLVINDTKVFPARMIGKKEDTGGEIEIFLLTSGDDIHWDALSRPAKRLKVGTTVVFGEGALRAVIEEKGDQGHVRVRLESDGPVREAIDCIGKTPLPPYIRREPDSNDRKRYQTVYARERGSVAAPTAGLHFSEPVLSKIRERGADVSTITLHVGIGTFRPLDENEADKDTLHDEYCIVPPETVGKIQSCKASGGRVFAVGTTTARALESSSRNGEIEAFEGWTDIFIKPPYDFRSVDCLVTNFHLPRSSLLMMVCAFAGHGTIMEAYEKAVREKYRFYSYGDAMLLLAKHGAMQM